MGAPFLFAGALALAASRAASMMLKQLVERPRLGCGVLLFIVVGRGSSFALSDLQQLMCRLSVASVNSIRSGEAARPRAKPRVQ